ncbi:MAG: hypothetical protein AAFV53_15210 [Myxococcota bacterium]
MSTDLYGVRVLEVDEVNARLRLRIFVVYYDTNYKYHQPVPDDRSFFVRVLCDKDALGEDISHDEQYDEGYIDRNAFRYIDRFVELARRNHPLASYDGYFDFYYERGGAWKDEEKLVQADYDVFVTKPEYVRAFTVGDSWGSTSYQTAADDLTMADYPHIPDLNDARTFTPFTDLEGEASTVDDLQFSADGTLLLAVHNEGGWRVFDLEDFSVVAEHVDIDDWNAAPGWTADGRVAWCVDGEWIAQRLDTGEREPIEIFGHQSSADGARHVVVVEPDDEGGECVARIRDASGTIHFEQPIGFDLMVYAAFDGEGRVAALSEETKSTIVIHFENGATTPLTDLRVNNMGMSPDGRYVVASTFGDAGIVVIRVSDGAIVRSLKHDRGRIPTGAAWSMDGSRVATSWCNRTGYSSFIQIHRTGAALMAAAQQTLTPPEPAGDSDITDVARLYIRQTAAFSSGWSDHLSDDFMDMHLAMQTMGLTGLDLVGHISGKEVQAATRAYEAIIATARGDGAAAKTALTQADELLSGHEVPEWAMTFTYAPLAAARWRLGDHERAAALLTMARVGLEDEANPFQKRAVLCRALMEMGRLDAVREIVDAAETGWVSDFHIRTLIDLIDLGAFELLQHVYGKWVEDDEWDAKEAVQKRLMDRDSDEARAVLAALFEEDELDDEDEDEDLSDDAFAVLCRRGAWPAAYAQISAEKPTLRNSMWSTVASAALQRRDVHILIDALGQLPCTDMNSTGLRALQNAFLTMAGRHHKLYHP